MALRTPLALALVANIILSLTGALAAPAMQNSASTRQAPMNTNVPAYRRSDLPVERRVEDLLSRMTVEEKARQLDMYSGRDSKFSQDGKLLPDVAKSLWGDIGVGSIHDLYPDDARLPNEIQAWLRANTRLGIPALFIEEGLHGFLDKGHTVFPQAIAIASTWNPQNARGIGAAIAAEMRAVNVHMSLSPVLCLARDPRWGRAEETYGEDPYLAGRMGVAYVQGMQGNSLATDHTVIAEPKHYVAHGSPEGGRNTATVHIGERELQETFLPVFRDAFVEGGAKSAMAAYHEIDGVPMTASHRLLTDILRGEWGFDGFVLSDLGAIERLEGTHHVAKDAEDAICQAISAGVDMQFYDYPHDVWVRSIVKGVADGSLAKADLDRAVARVLRVKFELGLFDTPDIDPGMAARVERAEPHKRLSLDVARQAICLLRNEGKLLPLRKDVKTIALIGPGADEARTGDYSGSGDGHFVSLREALPSLVSPETKILYAKGADFDEAGENSDATIAEAVNAARGADIAIVCLGESDRTCGEGHDRESLDLTGRQEDLLEAVSATGKPVVLVLQNGRALSIRWAAQHVPAIVEAWYPGEFGGRAIAEVLFGDVNPAGRLPVSFPKSVGQVPVTYDRKPSNWGGYSDDGGSEPLFRFGYGLSYTTFTYSNLAVSPQSGGGTETFTVSVDVRNTGERAGDEVVQLYLRDLVSSVTMPVQALKGFQRIHLAPGEQMTVTFRLGPNDLKLLDRDYRWVVEPGDFEVMAGGDSAGSLKARFTVTGTRPVPAGNR